MEEKKSLISSLVPRIYHNEPNKLTPYLKALDEKLQKTDAIIDSLPSLVNIDACPGQYLPYMAALTGTPLIGQDPVFWRKQIKTWPYICRMKGTRIAMEYYLDAVGSLSYQIPTYWRDQNGKYVVEKPEEAPFFDEGSGLWRNSKTHYFSLLVSLDEDRIQWDTALDIHGIKGNILLWMNFVKPFHAELLYFAWTLSLTDDESMEDLLRTSIGVNTFLEDAYQWDHSHYGDGRKYGTGNYYGTGENEDFTLSFGLGFQEGFSSSRIYGNSAIVGPSLIVSETFDGISDEMEIKLWRNGVEVNA